MKTIKIIDLLNKIANGEEVPKKIRIDHWCYEFEWVEHDSNYYDKHKDIDLMSCLSCDKEELNYEVHEIEEEKKLPEKLNLYKNLQDILNSDDESIVLSAIYDCLVCEKIKINEILDYLETKGE